MGLVAMKVAMPGKEMFEKHYADLSTKKFFPALIEYAASGPVCAMVWEGDNVVLTGRKMLGATKPSDSEPGTIRGDFCIDVVETSATAPTLLSPLRPRSSSGSRTRR